MGFLSTSAKHRRYQSLTQLVIFVLMIYDLRNGRILKSAFGEINPIIIFLWVWVLFTVLGSLSMMVMVGPFYRAGGKGWTQGGREQFAYAGGFTISFYGTLIVEAAAILVYPFLLLAYPILSVRGGWMVTLLSIVGTLLVCNIGARILFAGYRLTGRSDNHDGYP